MADSTAQPTSAKAKRRAWRVRWSLRALIVMVTLACVLSAWVGYRARIGQIHEDVAQKLTAVEDERSPFYSTQASVVVQWFYMEPVTRQRVSSNNWNPVVSRPTNRVLRRSVQKGVPDWMNDTGTGLLFQRIESIRVRQPLSEPTFDEVVKQICRLDRVPTLYFNVMNTKQMLKQHDLEQILANVEVDDIYAKYCPLDGGSIANLRSSRLKNLDLSHSWFGDAAVADLPTTLTWLDLERTAVTDAALPQFVRLHRLEHLCLYRTPTSEAAIKQLRESMPWCEITWEPLKQP